MKYQHHLYQPDVYEHIRVVRVDGSLHVNPRQLNESLEFLASWKKLSDVLISEIFYHKSKDINIMLNASSRIERENAVRNILHPLLIARNADQLRSFIRSGFQIPKTTNISEIVEWFPTLFNLNPGTDLWDSVLTKETQGGYVYNIPMLFVLINILTIPC